MSKTSERRRMRLTLALGAVAALAFGGVYGVVAQQGVADQTSTAAVANIQAAAPATPAATVTLTTAATTSAAAAASASAANTVATPMATAAPTASPAAATASHTVTRAS